MTRPNWLLLPAAVVACALAAQTAVAQTDSPLRSASATNTSTSFPQAETAFGWSYLHPDGGGPDSTLGGDVSVALNLSSWFGLAFDVSVNHFNGQLDDGSGWGQTEYGLLGGPKFALRQFGLFVPYAKLMAGYGRVNLDYNGSSTGSDFFVIEPGAGVDIGEGKFAARVQVSWRRMFDQSGGINRLRAVAGIVIRSAPKNSGGWQ
jgi:hypothetical protein